MIRDKEPLMKAFHDIEADDVNEEPSQYIPNLEIQEQNGSHDEGAF